MCGGTAWLVASSGLDAERITCPVRIVWGLDDQLLPWPDAAVRYRRDWLPHADWVELDGVGHCPQLDVPLETAQLILGSVMALVLRRQVLRDPSALQFTHAQIAESIVTISMQGLLPR